MRIIARINFAGLYFQPGRTREALELRVPVDGWLSSHCSADMPETSLGWRPIGRRHSSSDNTATGSYSQSASASKCRASSMASCRTRPTTTRSCSTR